MSAMLDVVQRLGGPPARSIVSPYIVVRADGDRAREASYRRLRREAFVEAQGLFAATDADELDGGPDTVVLIALDEDGQVCGGVRLHPEGGDAGLGWWRGSRLVARACAGASRGRVGAGLVGAACAAALDHGALRFDAHVQADQERFFARLGWIPSHPIEVAGQAHLLMRWPINRVRDLAAGKAPLGPLLDGLAPGGTGFVGDDGAPLSGTDVIACADAIVPSMVERDPEWAGWCGMLVTAHDLSAMGARPVAALDALGAADAAAAERVMRGLRRGVEAFDLPLIGGHTQLGVPAALSVTGLGRTDSPVRAGGGGVGDAVSLTADVEGGWRPGYRGRQWDSTSWRTREDLRAMLDAVPRARPRAAKDVSMAGIAGTAGMLAEACGTGVELDVHAVPRPGGVSGGDWLTCFPGFAMLTADTPAAGPLQAGPAVSARCGTLTATPGVRLRWPDGVVTEALAGPVTGLGGAGDV